VNGYFHGLKQKKDPPEADIRCDWFSRQNFKIFDEIEAEFAKRRTSTVAEFE
jgi:hypothetical protein